MPEAPTPWQPPDEQLARELLNTTRARQKARREQAREARIAAWTRSLMASSTHARRTDDASESRPGL